MKKIAYSEQGTRREVVGRLKRECNEGLVEKLGDWFPMKGGRLLWARRAAEGSSDGEARM